jgi:hypothetical protein
MRRKEIMDIGTLLAGIAIGLAIASILIIIADL